jgi:hypothetical protein
MLTLELEPREHELLLEILEAVEREKRHELHRADSLEYKQLLRERIDSIERLIGKLVVVAGRV